MALITSGCGQIRYDATPDSMLGAALPAAGSMAMHTALFPLCAVTGAYYSDKLPGKV